MDTQLENNYPHSMDFALQLAIDNGFLSLKDFGRLGNVDKFLNSLCKKHIEKYYEILSKCSFNEFITQTSFNHWNNNDFPNEFNRRIIYKYNDNWDEVFGKILNKDEMAFYYSYFVFKFHKFYRIDSYSKFWSCILNKNGYIKSFSDNSYLGISNIDDTDIILNIQINYSYLIWRNQPKKLNYWGTKTRFENKGKEIQVDFVNLNLLDKLITSDNYRNIVSKNFL